MSDTTGTVLDVLAAICLIGGSSLTFAAGLGLTRFPDLLARMHAATKPQVLGLILMMLGLGLRLRSGPIIWMLVLVALFQMLTSPVAAHMVARAGYRTGKVRFDLLVVDELTRDLGAARTQVRADADEQRRSDDADEQRRSEEADAAGSSRSDETEPDDPGPDDDGASPPPR